MGECWQAEHLEDDINRRYEKKNPKKNPFSSKLGISLISVFLPSQIPCLSFPRYLTVTTGISKWKLPLCSTRPVRLDTWRQEPFGFPTPPHFPFPLGTSLCSQVHGGWQAPTGKHSSVLLCLFNLHRVPYQSGELTFNLTTPKPTDIQFMASALSSRPIRMGSRTLRPNSFLQGSPYQTTPQR